MLLRIMLLDYLDADCLEMVDKGRRGPTARPIFCCSDMAEGGLSIGERTKLED